ncbi:molybdenum cofactor guanylyltransferase [Mycolicibacterium brumae]|uniref:Molybdopterin-guanine dinucleotide biosynthesis protein n=1 Tax=Mycolicibacterium brumae TaxID=85968 RepID=A0A2G5PDH2_9MYCO|nr:NTP transferase domain-containing protein [Mycolicibacterium brumae]MCV7193487.1 nucleotidyltransferase family protein [Mycolicibacterium brumae]PIB76073.1 molybdopterin-guanine dinucleotide biosynthesis protein [Mycolicibacterium brumae]RWA17186.1 hypothetical protein MBRU_06060 [Mycolicibacterium brumae DSM 44177]UWW09240.1 nucleotidyltransferase family protein [Mycolicibacterium brumae]
MTAAILLVGGRGSRLGGAVKPLLELGGQTLLDRTVMALAGCAPIIAVGPVLEDDPRLTWVREDPPLAGPAAAIAAGVSALHGDDGVLVLAGDLVYPDSTVRRLLTAPIIGDAVVLRAGGRPQWLAGKYRAAALRRAAVGLGTRVAGASCQLLLGELAVRWLDDEDGVSADIDTAADLDRARAAYREGDR